MSSNQPEEREAREKRELSGEPDFSAPVKPIAEFVTREDFPECVLGEHVDIGGHIGVVVGVVRQSIRVRSPEGATTSFNSYGLRRIYGPREPERAPRQAAADERLDIPPAGPGMFTEMPPAVDKKAPAPPAHEAPREIEPDFDQPAIPIAELVTAPDFPANALGKQVDVGGYSGVVVQIVNQSLKIRSRAGTSRGYNAQQLRNIFRGG